MNVLIVEDDPATGRLLLAVLSRSGHLGLLCGSAEEAQERLAADGEDAWPCCVIDLALPGKDGLWLCRWIRSQPGGDCPYLLVGTGSDHQHTLGKAFEAGADDYIEKPFEPHLLDLRFAVANQRIEGRNERQRLARSLDDEQRLVRSVFDTAAACILALDERGCITKSNGAAARLLSRSSRQIRGMEFGSCFTESGTLSPGNEEKLSSIRESDSADCQFETEIVDPSGKRRTLAWSCRHSPAREAPHQSLTVCVGTDITNRRQLESQLVFLAERDPLTHLFNRSQLNPTLQNALNLALQERPGALLCLDLDDFKIVNDTAGHATGDALLQAVAHLISREVRAEDTVIRLGGDEFVVVLPDISWEEACAIAEAIRHAIEHLDFTTEGRVFRITASIGVSSLRPRLGPEEALAQADAACYASKRDGRNLVSLSQRYGQSLLSSDQAWHTRLIEAIAHDAVDLWLQPIVSLQTGETEFQEVLLRIPGSEGASHPSQFLPSARRFNLLPELDRCVVKNAIALLQSNPRLNLSVNLSGKTVSDPRVADFLVSSLREKQVAPGRVIFEITESELISDLPLAIDRLNHLRTLGFRFALDDFGRGYSSFSYLRDLPVEIVKIDGSYTQSLADDPASAAFIKAITELAHALGMTCVAEHVETRESADALQALEVDLAQGYFLGEPRSYAGSMPDREQPKPGVALAN